MQNLEQKRAAHALEWASEVTRGKADGEVVKKIPPLVMNNGILASMAFAVEPGKDGYKNPGHYSVFKAIVSHLQENTKLNIPKDSSNSNVESFLALAAKRDSIFLRAVTGEALAYLSYLRRFVKKGKNHGQNH